MGFWGVHQRVPLWLFRCTLVFFRLSSRTPELPVVRQLRLVARQTIPRFASGRRPGGLSPCLSAPGVCSFGALSCGARGSFSFPRTNGRTLASPRGAVLGASWAVPKPSWRPPGRYGRDFGGHRHPQHEVCQTSCGWEGGMFARSLEMPTSSHSSGTPP